MFAIYIFEFLLLLTLLGCSKADTNTSPEWSSQEENLPKLESPDPSLQIPPLYSQLRDFSTSDSSRFRYYEDHVIYYEVAQPNHQVYGSPVSRVLLVYIDEMLCRKAYDLKDDISDELIESLRNMKIRPYDSTSRAIVRKKQALVQQEEQRIINPALSYYHLISDQPDKQLEYKCRKREGWYSLEEKAPFYDVVMAQMESGHY